MTKQTGAKLDREIDDFFTRHVREAKSRQKMLHQALLKHPAMVVTGPRGRKTLLIQSGEMSNPEEGKHRVTQFLDDGPLGHMTRSSITKLAQELSRDLMPHRIEPATDADVTEWMSTPKYQEGAEHVLEMQRRNRR